MWPFKGTRESEVCLRLIRVPDNDSKVRKRPHLELCCVRARSSMKALAVTVGRPSLRNSSTARTRRGSQQEPRSLEGRRKEGRGQTAGVGLALRDTL